MRSYAQKALLVFLVSHYFPALKSMDYGDGCQNSSLLVAFSSGAALAAAAIYCCYCRPKNHERDLYLNRIRNDAKIISQMDEVRANASQALADSGQLRERKVADSNIPN